MKLFTLRLCMLVICAFQLAEGKAQKIDSMMNLYASNFPQEKLHVHFDKSFYNPGETIWFKGYVLTGANLSEVSRNFYAELIDESGKVLQRSISPMVNSSAAGNFTIPAGYSSPVVQVRAYTTWMLNFDTSFIFKKDIRILSNNVKQAQGTPNTSFLQFFPEGGDLVTGLESMVAFKASDRAGMPVKVTGIIRTADGKKAGEFKSVHNGLGTLTLQPVKGQKYTAYWKDSTGKEKTTALPEPVSSGVVLHASNTPGGVMFVIKRTEDDNPKLKQVFVVAHMHQHMVYQARVNFSNSHMNSGRIPADQVPSGILQVTVFNSDWEPLAERVIFVNNNDYIFDAYFRTLSKNLNKRGRNVIEIEIPDTTLSNLSLSITDEGAGMPPENEGNIYSSLLLTGDIKGYVHNPGYYFSSFADSVSRHLDLVMLTHGWRRFNWKDLAQGKLPQIRFMPENFITLQGTVLGINPATISRNNQLNLIMQKKDSTNEFMSVPVLPGGKIDLPGMVFYDTVNIYYQLNDKRSTSNLILKVENNLWKGYEYVERITEPHLVSAPDSVVLKNRDLFNRFKLSEADRIKKTRMLEEVIVRGKARSAEQKMEELYTSGLFKGGDGYSFDLTSDISAMGAMSVFAYLQGRVPGLQINNAMGGQPSLSWRGGTPDLFLNEMRSDVQSITSLSMADIAYVKVFRPPFIGAMGGGGGGAIAVYTKKGGAAPVDFVGLNKITISGYSPQRQFYSPDYSKSNPLHDLEDLRTTLYWEPFIFLDGEKKKKIFTFYNNDLSKTLRVTIEGVNEHGKLTRVEESIR